MNTFIITMGDDKRTKFSPLIALFKRSYDQKPELKCDNYLKRYDHALPVNVLTSLPGLRVEISIK